MRSLLKIGHLFSVSVASNFVFAIANANRAKSGEFSWLVSFSCCIFCAVFVWLHRLQI